jgi:hypothetical protein
MGHRPALKLAFDLLDFPSQVRVLRKAPVPIDVVVLLRIAAGDEESIQQATRASGRPLRAVRDAAGFLIEQILLFPEADSYRVLGASPRAPNFELRRNMALLLRWLHPDVDRRGERSIFAARVTKAWSDLKTADRRAAYDQELQKTLAEAALRQKEKARRNKRARHTRAKARSHASLHRYYEEPGLLRRLLLTLFGRAVL